MPTALCRNEADFCLAKHDGYPFRKLSKLFRRRRTDNTDPAITRVNTVCVADERTAKACVASFGYGHPLGLTLLNNPHTKVVHLDLEARIFLRFETIDLEPAGPMLDYLRISSSLQSLNLEDNMVDLDMFYCCRRTRAYDRLKKWIKDESCIEAKERLKGQIIVAAAANPGLHRFAARAGLPVDEFAHFLRTTRSVSEFELGGDCSYEICSMESSFAGSISVIADAFAANESIRTLELYCPYKDAELPAQILQRLGSRDAAPAAAAAAAAAATANPSFCTVNLYIRNDFPDALKPALNVSTALQTLDLSDLELDIEAIELLSMNQSVARLSIWACRFSDGAATPGFISFVKTRANREGVSAVRVLQLRLRRFWNVNDAFAPNLDVNEALSGMLFGSALHTLELYTCQELDLQDFFQAAADADEKQFQLQCLRLNYLVYHVAMVNFLVRTTTLRDFEAEMVRPNANELIRALRSNGSLHTVQFTARGPYPTNVFDDDMQRRVDLYCTRNKRLPELLQTRPSQVPTPETRNDKETKLKAFPALFAAALPTSANTATTNLVSGLLSISEAHARPDGLRTRR